MYTCETPTCEGSESKLRDTCHDKVLMTPCPLFPKKSDSFSLLKQGIIVKYNCEEK